MKWLKRSDEKLFLIIRAQKVFHNSRHLFFLPKYSPHLNLIETQWLRAEHYETQASYFPDHQKHSINFSKNLIYLAIKLKLQFCHTQLSCNQTSLTSSI